MAHPLYWPQKSFFYPIGNTTPRVLTQYLAPGEDGKLLLLGCGDTRNILYTIHSNRNDSISLDFTCVDVESAILARNVILLTLLMDDSSGSNADLIFNIFYEFFLPEEALSLLKSQCDTLLHLSSDAESWNSSPYGRVVRFCNSFTLKEVRRIWQGYTTIDTTGSFKTRYQDGMAKTKEYHSSIFIRGRSAGPFFVNAMVSMTDIFHEFWKHGIMSTNPSDIASATHVNPMFAHWSQGSGFVAHHATFPPLAFHLAPAFASIQSSSRTPIAISSDIIFEFVKNEFKHHCSSYRKMATTKSSRPNLKIRFVVGDALHVCHTLHRPSNNSNFAVATWNAEPLMLDSEDYRDVADPSPTTFNVIDTSNLSDHLGILNVLIASIPLLARSPTSTLYTETLLEYGENAEKSIAAFAHCLGTDLASMALLLDLVPLTLLSEFDTISNVHEVVPYRGTAGMGQYHERTSWKIPSLVEPGIVPGITFDPDLLARLLFNIYLRMFPWEDLSNRMRGMYLGEHSHVERIHHSRLTLALFIHLIRSRVTTDWNQSMKNLLSLMSSGKTLLIGPQSVQDFSCHLDKLGIYSVTNFAPVDPAEVARLTKLSVKRLQIFDVVPPIISIILVVPRSKLDVLQDPELGNPGLHAVVRSDQFLNYFTPAQAIFGTIVVGEADNATYVSLDPLGKSGSSPLILTFWIPSWTLTLTRKEITVALAVQKVSQTSKLSSTLGSNLELYATSFEDKDHVLLGEALPRIEGHREVPTSPVFAKYPVPPETPVRAAVSTDSTSIQSFVIRVEVNDKDAQAQLAQKTTPINVVQKSPHSVELTLGTTLKKILSYPFPVDGIEAMLRIARTSHYIEVVTQLAAPRKPGGLRLNRFPIVRAGRECTPWNLHRVDIDSLPVIDLDDSSKVEWLGSHSMYMMSQRERSVHEGSVPEDAAVDIDGITDIKNSLHAILTTVAGVYGTQRSVFALKERESDNLKAIIFIAGLRLDSPGHTVVADGFVLPMDQEYLKAIAQTVSKLAPTMAGIKTTPQEVDQWQSLLSALAERCRKWKHDEGCSGSLIDQVLACGCGRGKDVETFKEREEWAELAPYVTRIALSPLFAVSYIDTI